MKRWINHAGLSRVLLTTLIAIVPGNLNGADLSQKPQPRGSQGFSYRRDDIPEGPWSVQVITVDRAKTNLQLHTSLGKGRLFGLAPLSEQMKQQPRKLGRPLAAVNGDYYRDEGAYQGDPKGLMIMQGELISGPCDWTCFWLDASGQPQMTNVSSRFEVTWPDERKVPFGLNEDRARSNAVLYTAVVGASTRTSGGVELILERNGTESWLPLRVGETYPARIREIREGGNAPLTPDTMVLSLNAQTAADVPALRPGMVVQLSTRTVPALSNVTTAIGGGPALVRNGKIVPRDEINVRNPRTALGWNDQSIYLIQVDGRSLNLSVGMTTRELSEYLVKLGCESAMSLDGGGSSTCWVYGQVMNNPSEGFERSMANALFLVRTQNP